MTDPDYTPWVTTALIGFVMYRRVRRQFGRQPLRVRALGIRLGILGLVAIGLVVLACTHAELLLPIAGGIAAGAIVAVVNLRLTRFEWTPQGDFYYPHPYVGAALSLLLVGRLAYRLAVLGGPQALGSAAPGTLPTSTPLTSGLMALLIGYYVAYLVGLLILRGQHHRPGGPGDLSVRP